MNTLTGHRSTSRRLHRPRKNADAGRGAGFRRLSGGRIFASSGDWDSGSIAFTVSSESRGALFLTSGHSRRFPGMLWSLNTLSSRGKPSDSRTFLRVLPDCIGNTTERLAAQLRHITRALRGSTINAFTMLHAFPPCCCPLAVSRPGKAGGPEASSFRTSTL